MAITKRYFIELAYDGTKYHGWQIQDNAVSVQEVLNKALSTVLRTEAQTTGAGRTDTGVHARQLYAHIDLEGDSIPERSRLLTGLNALLPYDIAVLDFFEVSDTAHARFDATLRSYEYHIHFAKDPFKINRSWLVKDPLDIAAMNLAAQYMMEYEDFTSFSKAHTQTATNNCKISCAKWVLQPDGLVFYVSADRFLRNMVRAIVGTLVQVGKHLLAPEDIRSVIESKNRSNAGQSVPACGLYLTEVKYPYI